MYLLFVHVFSGEAAFEGEVSSIIEFASKFTSTLYTYSVKIQ